MSQISSRCLEEVKAKVYTLLQSDRSGHSTDHIARVLDLSLKFAATEQADPALVWLIALLHDVDDHKLFGDDCAQNLTHARKIMTSCQIDPEILAKVCDSLQTIGYSKRLRGLKPKDIAGQIVSDADMCDGLGARGLLRTYAYQLKHDHPFFDRQLFPSLNLTAEQYATQTAAETGVGHCFEKLLHLKDLMLTKSGQAESTKRHDFMVNFLREFFLEENAVEWLEYLECYLAQSDSASKQSAPIQK